MAQAMIEELKRHLGALRRARECGKRSEVPTLDGYRVFVDCTRVELREHARQVRGVIRDMEELARPL